MILWRGGPCPLEKEAFGGIKIGSLPVALLSSFP